MKILIVEDEPSLREIMVRTLTREQYLSLIHISEPTRRS